MLRNDFLPITYNSFPASNAAWDKRIRRNWAVTWNLFYVSFFIYSRFAFGSKFMAQLIMRQDLSQNALSGTTTDPPYKWSLLLVVFLFWGSFFLTQIPGTCTRSTCWGTRPCSCWRGRGTWRSRRRRWSSRLPRLVHTYFALKTSIVYLGIILTDESAGRGRYGDEEKKGKGEAGVHVWKSQTKECRCPRGEFDLYCTECSDTGRALPDKKIYNLQ